MAYTWLPPRPTSPPDSKALPISQDAIVLPGFDLDIQLNEIDFSAHSFKVAFFTKIYTKEQYTDKIPPSRIRDVRYGNNVTLLFRVCYYCSAFYGHPDYWSTIGRGFHARSHVVQDLAETLIRARKAFLRRHGFREKTAATAACDSWITYVEGRGSRTDSFRANGDALNAKAASYFEGAQNRHIQDNSACVPTHRSYEPSADASYKRARSPSSVNASPIAKRRPSPDHFGRRNDPALAANTLASTEVKLDGQGRQPCGTTISTRDESKHTRGRSSSPTPAGNAFENLRVQGRAVPQTNSNVTLGSSPSGKFKANNESLARTSVQMVDVRGANLGSTDSTQGKSVASNAQPIQDSKAEDMARKLAVLEKRLAAIEDQPSHKAILSADVHAAILKLQTRLAELETQRKKDQETSQISIAALWEALSAAAINGIFTPITPRLTEAVQTESMKEPQVEADSLGLQLGEELQGEILRRTPADVSVNHIQKRLDAAEPAGLRTNSTGMQALRSRVDALETRLESVANQPRTKKEFASKGHLEHIDKQLRERLAAVERELAEDKKTVKDQSVMLKSIKDNLASLEVQNNRVIKTLEIPKTPKSPSPPQAITLGMEGMQPKIKGLATVSTVTEKMHQVETHVQAILQESEQKLNDRLQIIIADLDAVKNQMKGTMTADKLFQVEQNLRSAVERSQRDIDVRLDSFATEVDTAKAQIKGFNHLLNETTTEMAKQSTVKALEDDLALLNTKVDASSTTSSSELERRIGHLSIQVRQVLGGITPAEVSNKLEELHNKVDALQKSAGGESNEKLTAEVAALRNHVYVVANRFTELVDHLAS